MEIIDFHDLFTLIDSFDMYTKKTEQITKWHLHMIRVVNQFQTGCTLTLK